MSKKPTLHTPAGQFELLGWRAFETMLAGFKVWPGTIYVVHSQFDPDIYLESARIVAHGVPPVWSQGGNFLTTDGSTRAKAHYWPVAITYRTGKHLGIPLNIFHDRVIYPKPSE